MSRLFLLITFIVRWTIHNVRRVEKSNDEKVSLCSILYRMIQERISPEDKIIYSVFFTKINIWTIVQ